MLNWTKINKEFTKVLNSYTDEEFDEWYEMDRKRMALVDMENGLDGKLNGAQRINGAAKIKPKSKGVPVKKTTRAKVGA